MGTLSSPGCHSDLVLFLDASLVLCCSWMPFCSCGVPGCQSSLVLFLDASLVLCCSWIPVWSCGVPGCQSGPVLFLDAFSATYGSYRNNSSNDDRFFSGCFNDKEQRFLSINKQSFLYLLNFSMQLTLIISNSKGPECLVWDNSSLKKKELK